MDNISNIHVNRSMDSKEMLAHRSQSDSRRYGFIKFLLLHRYMETTDLPMSKRIIRPNEINDTSTIKAEKYLSNQNGLGTHKYDIKKDIRFNQNRTVIENLNVPSKGTISLLNQREKASNEFGKNLHLNRDTSEDNMLRLESKRRANKALKNFTHSSAL